MVIDPRGSVDSLKTLRMAMIFLSVSKLVTCAIAISSS
jgi:hypothetical protein